MANQIHEELEKWPTFSNFLFCTLISSLEGLNFHPTEFYRHSVCTE